jgi:hypothetical protein
MTATAYERIIDRLRNQGKSVRQRSTETRAQCPATGCPAQSISLAVYPKQGKVKVICYAGCNDALDILPAINMTVGDLYDERGTGPRTACEPDPELQARIEARRNMTPGQRALDDLLQLPDLAERLCLAAARIRPELYIWEREQIGGEVNG